MCGWTKKRRMMQRYDLTAHLYDMRYAEEQNAKIKAALKNVNLKKKDLVLDVGCGTGLLFEHIADKTEATVGLDISKRTLLQAKRRAKDHLNVHLIQADGDHMPLKDKIFSYIFAMTFIQNTPRPIETLSEIKRVGKSNAFFIVTGLKRIFTLECFEKLIRDAGLEIVALHDEGLQCYVAVCSGPLH